MTKTALIIGASGGIGRAIARQLNADGWSVTGLSRSAGGLDYGDPESVDRLLGGVESPVDLIFIATGALEIDGHGPEKALRQIDAAALEAQFRTNTIGPALVLRHAARLLPRDRPATIAALSARVGSIGDNRLGGWYGYRAAKAALNQIMHGAAIELARTHKQAVCVALHPGTVETDLTAVHGAGYDKVTPDQAAANLLGVLGGLTPEDTGLFFDWQGKRVEW
ncbi:MAG: SDR family NAD(P)-dependent oxidoreductase [Maritimibacter sp.]|uniref:SDR family NAD(P)-dependent oxidoreductase n=1 Tax=Maritimibacter sp. TaxID=2003363 RepID=UPI001DDC25A0|nr:SDR family NAD(P)-dependent oxidoreductase [Maritimibacter sp.]MBL6426952.1 SDR family NAD(P)-dependent oxidoreductase [Maritimibacter sp.]